MRSDLPLSVVIVGGGFCGTMTVVNLIRKSEGKKLRISLFNKKYPLAKGIAFRSYSDLHLLNVETRNMGAFPEEPEHFLNWCLQNHFQNKSREEIRSTYLPRNMYGEYLEDLFQSTIRHLPSHIELEIIDDEVVNISRESDGLIVHSAKGIKKIADKLILATGNSEPGAPSIKNTTFFSSNKYFSNPWSEKAVHGLKDEKPVLIIGTGLTMVDVVLGLQEKKFEGKIFALSPHGYKILPHKQLPPQPYILEELTPPYDLDKLFKLFYKHIRLAHKMGLPGETVVDAIRSKTQEIWQNFSMDDKKKFMNHLRHLWGVARHRLPSQIHTEIDTLINNKRLQVIAGRIADISENENHAVVKIIRRNMQHSDTELEVSRIINCTGPQTDISRQKSRLYNQMIKDGIARPDEMRLGIEADSDGRIYNSVNKPSNQVYALGNLLKGKLWESTAIPELRKQVSRVAELVLNNDKIFDTEIR